MSGTANAAAAPARVDFVDALRGFALFGLFMVHMSELFELYWAKPQPGPVHTIVFGLFAGKSYALLALCFGFSFFSMGDGAARRGEPGFAARFAWRLVLLMGFGFLHGLLYRGDIIVVLAAEGFLLIPFFFIRSERLLLVVAAICFLSPFLLLRIGAAYEGADWALAQPFFMADPSMPAYMTGTFMDALRANLGAGSLVKWSYFMEGPRGFHIFGLFLIGLLCGRRGTFAKDVGGAMHLMRIAVSALLLVAALVALSAAGPVMQANPGPGFHIGLLMAGWIDLAATFLSLFVFHALWQSAVRPAIAWLAAPGRMTLSFYLGQSVIFVPVFYGWGWGAWDWMSQGETVIVGLVAFALQALAAIWWLKRYHYGPLEWLWRAATRMTTAVPFRRS